jgi:hypothetical protein
MIKDSATHAFHELVKLPIRVNLRLNELCFLRVRLDVDIEQLNLNWESIPNQTSIGNGFQYQINCLDVDEIASWNPMRWQILIHVWMCVSPNRQLTIFFAGTSPLPTPNSRRRRRDARRIEDEEEPDLCGCNLISLILEAEHLGDGEINAWSRSGLISPIRAARGAMRGRKMQPPDRALPPPWSVEVGEREEEEEGGRREEGGR